MAIFNSVLCNRSISKWASWDASSHLNTPSLVPRKSAVRYPTKSSCSSQSTAEFMQVYDSIKHDLLHDSCFEFDDTSRQWVDQMIDYNVLGGKMTRGLSVVDSYKLLKGGLELTDDETFLSCALGWCIEWLQGYIIVYDDMMDGSHTRRGHPCWFRLPEVRMVAVNDGALLRSHVYRILKKHFHGKHYYTHLVDLFNEVEYQTMCGQLIDVITMHGKEKDLSKYTLSLNLRIVQYKSSYYSFYLPVACALLMFGENLDDHVQLKDILIEMGIYYQIQVACALLMFGENLDDHVQLKDILIEMGIYYQIQNDYLDTYGDHNVVGKIGTDIENFKCSWLVAKALELANEEQKKVLYDNYGINDPLRVEAVKKLYHTLNLQDVYEEYENDTYMELMKLIKAHPSDVAQLVLKSFMDKIYKRQK